MIIDIGRLSPQGEWFDGEVPAAALDMAGVRDLEITSPVSCHLHVLRVGSQLLVRGALNVGIRCRCSRCTEWCSPSVREPAFEATVDIPDEYEEVDLTAEIREAMLLTFPSYPVCRDTCRGLCPTCGANRNERECDCRPPGDSRWSILGQLSSGGMTPPER